MTRHLRIPAALALALLLLAVPAARAQTPFALRNVGQKIVSDDARMVARGWGMTVADSLHPGFKNVASLSSLRHVAIKFTGYGERGENEDADGTRRTYRVVAPDIRVALPVLKSRLAVTAGFHVKRAAHWATRTDTSWVRWDTQIEGNHQFVRDGSMFDVPLGAALQVLPGVSLGTTVNLENGTFRESIGDFFLEPNSGNTINPIPLYQPNLQVTEDSFRGSSMTFGLLLAPGRRFRLAASYTPAYDLDVERKVTLEGVASQGNLDYTLAMPREYRGGFEYRVRGRWRVGGDYQFMQFSELRGNPAWEAAAEDEQTWSVGLERMQAQARRGGMSNLPIRLSYGQRRWAYAVGGNPVDEQIYSIGTGFPFRRNLGQLDLALSWLRIGDLEQNGARSDVWRLTVSVTGLEVWW